VGSFAGPANFLGCLRSGGLPFPPVRAVKVGGCRHRICILGFGFLVRNSVATRQHARLIGAAVGSILGILGAYLMGLILARTSIPEGSRSFLDVALLLVMTYIGLVIGASKGDMLNLQALGGLFGSERSTRRMPKVLDTSVIIDGRIADICEAHFLDGVLLIPQFVLRELQLVADSADSMKRQRGRRGLEVLQRIQRWHTWKSKSQTTILQMSRT